jgi:hypothetical protein
MKKIHNARLIFKLYAEFELKSGSNKNVLKIKERAEQYLEEHYKDKTAPMEEESE